MNRIQFWTLTLVSTLVVVCLLLQVIFAHQAQHAQQKVYAGQQLIQEGRLSATRWNQLVERIVQVSQQTQDQGLRDLLTRQGITVKANPNATGTPISPAASAPAPAVR